MYLVLFLLLGWTLVFVQSFMLLSATTPARRAYPTALHYDSAGGQSELVKRTKHIRYLLKNRKQGPAHTEVKKLLDTTPPSELDEFAVATCIKVLALNDNSAQTFSLLRIVEDPAYPAVQYNAILYTIAIDALGRLLELEKALVLLKLIPPEMINLYHINAMLSAVSRAAKHTQKLEAKIEKITDFPLNVNKGDDSDDNDNINVNTGTLLGVGFSDHSSSSPSSIATKSQMFDMEVLSVLATNIVSSIGSLNVVADEITIMNLISVFGAAGDSQRVVEMLKKFGLLPTVFETDETTISVPITFPVVPKLKTSNLIFTNGITALTACKLPALASQLFDEAVAKKETINIDTYMINAMLTSLTDGERAVEVYRTMGDKRQRPDIVTITEIVQAVTNDEKILPPRKKELVDFVVSSAYERNILKKINDCDKHILVNVRGLTFSLAKGVLLHNVQHSLSKPTMESISVITHTSTGTSTSTPKNINNSLGSTSLQQYLRDCVAEEFTTQTPFEILFK